MDDDETLCSECSRAEEIARAIVEVFSRLSALKHPRLPIPPASPWEAFTLEQRRGLIMTCRGTVEAFRDGLFAAMTQDAVEAIEQLNRLQDFVDERQPDAVREGEDLAAALIRLLEPHIGSRIVLPGRSA